MSWRLKRKALLPPTRIAGVTLPAVTQRLRVERSIFRRSQTSRLLISSVLGTHLVLCATQDLSTTVARSFAQDLVHTLWMCNAHCMSEQRTELHIPEWTLGERLEKSLKDAGLTPDDMALEMDVHRNTVGNWISGRTAIKKPALRIWAMRCGVPLEWLRSGSADAEASDVTTQRNVSDRERAVA